MSTTLSVGATAYSIQSAKPTTVFGQLAQLPLRWNAAQAQFQVSLAKIPKGATIVSAVVQFRTVAAQSGTYTARVYTTAKWPSTLTWAKRPASTLVGQVAVTNPGASALFAVDVTSTVQQMVTGTIPNNGWAVTIAENATLKVRGSAATSGRPVLVVTYTVRPPTPTNLEPSNAAVSVDKPVLLFDADPTVTGLRVQIDPAADSVSPDFDSGPVAATGGLLDLAGTTYAGLAAGASTYWRAQQQTDGGWSDWSPWVSFSHQARAALTITSPAGVEPVAVEDGTPPITWTFAGTQVAWRARLLDANGDPIADSGRNLGADTDWTPPKGLVSTGQAGLIEVTVWDNTDRAATPGDPAETIATVEVVLTPDATIGGYTSVTAANVGRSPVVAVSGHRSAIPDAVALVRDGREVGRWDGADVTVPATGGYVTTVTDLTAVMGRPAVYSLVPVVNAKKGPPGVTVTYTPRCVGIWLTSVETAESVVLWGNDDVSQSQPELAVVHRPIIEGDAVPVVRRRLMRSAPEGELSGVLVDVGDYPAEVMEERLRAWVDGDAGDLFTLTLAGYTGRVIIGDVTFTEVNSNPGDGRMLAVSLNWWAQ